MSGDLARLERWFSICALGFLAGAGWEGGSVVWLGFLVLGVWGMPCAGDRESHTLIHRSSRLHSTPTAGLPLPRICRAPSLRLGPNRSRAFVNAWFTDALLPITAPSVNRSHAEIGRRIGHHPGTHRTQSERLQTLPENPFPGEEMAHHMAGVERNQPTTRERSGRLRPSTKQPPEEGAAHRMDKTEWRQMQW